MYKSIGVVFLVLLVGAGLWGLSHLYIHSASFEGSSFERVSSPSSVEFDAEKLTSLQVIF